jgi:N-acylneuraminate cytidylyltransferase
MEVLAVVPARGGSKSIPKKNLAPVMGRPILERAIEGARASNSIGRLVVSTDDDEIRGVAESMKVDVIDRPAEYATDEASTEVVLIHALDTLKDREGYEPDIVVTLEPTSPLRSGRLIDRCIEAFDRTDADAVISVVDTSALVGRVDADGQFSYLMPGQPRRRQDRQPLYRESSTVYATRTETLRRTGSVLGKRLHAVVAEPYEAIDINEPIDLAIVEAVMKWRQKEAEEQR